MGTKQRTVCRAATKTRRPFSVVVLASHAEHHLFKLHHGRPLLDISVRQALASGAAEVVVVVGRRFEEVRRRLQRLPIRVVRDRDAVPGLASSIRHGVAALSSKAIPTVITRVDRPGVTGRHLRRLALELSANPNTRIAATGYQGVVGVPCAFHPELFHDLLHLQGNAGAHDLVRRGDHALVMVACEPANHRVVLAQESVSIWSPVRSFRAYSPYPLHLVRAPPTSQTSLSRFRRLLP